MNKLEFTYPEAKRPHQQKRHVGVVGSGDMEVLSNRIVKREPGLHHDQRQMASRCVEAVSCFFSKSMGGPYLH